MGSNVVFKVFYSLFSGIRLIMLIAFIFCGKILKKSFLIMTPVHGNLGDHAIAKAEINYLKQYNISCVEIPGKYLKILDRYNFLGVMNGSAIIINGGGNIGTIWPEYEMLIEDVIKANASSKIIIMPSTAYFENDDQGVKAAAKAADVFKDHPDFTIFARENISYGILKNLHLNVKLCPDIVFSMNESMPVTSRRGCLFCLREDREKTLTEEEVCKIRSVISTYFDVIKDTRLDYFSKITLSKRNRMLSDKFDEFRSAELVITDRMHGLVFAVITGTPCVVLNSKSHKIVGTYQWVKDLDYIYMLNSECEIDTIIDPLIESTKKRFRYDPETMRNAFRELDDFFDSFV